MRPILWTLLAAVGLAGSSLAKEEPSFFPYPLKVDRLPNGLAVVRVPFRSPGLVAYYSVVRVGSRNEVEPDHTGFAHFFEHMMFKGTKRFPEGERERLLSRLGFNDNAFTTDDVTVYHSFGPASGLEQLIQVEADRFRHLDYSEATFQTEAKAVLGEYHKGAAHPEQKIEEVLAATAFTHHPYRHTTLGFYDDIKRMPQYYEYSREFFKRWYTPDNAMVFVVGDFDDAQLLRWVTQNYGGWQGHPSQVAIPPEPIQQRERSAHIDWPTPTLPRHFEAWHTPSSDLNTYAGPIQTLLGPYLVGPTSPLYKELVLHKQVAESLSSGFSDHRDANLFSLIAVLKDEKDRPPVQQALDAAVAELASGKVDNQRVADVQSNQAYGLLMGLETADQVAVQLAYLGGVLGEPNALDRYYRNLKKVRPEQLVAFAKKYLTNNNRTVLTLSSKANPPAQTGAHP